MTHAVLPLAKPGGDLMKRRRRAAAALITALIILALCAAAVFVEYRLKSVRSRLEEFTANNYASSAVTYGVEKALAAYRLNYTDVVTFTYDGDGNIKSVTTDILTLNTLGNRIGAEVDKKLEEKYAHDISIPLSSLLDEEIFSGVGPEISMHFTVKGSANTKFEDKFESSGVNQTRHRIFLNIKVESYVISGSDVRVITYTSNVCIAESIIVGVTPQTFANLN